MDACVSDPISKTAIPESMIHMRMQPVRTDFCRCVMANISSGMHLPTAKKVKLVIKKALKM